MTTQPIVEHFDGLKDILCRFVPCAGLAMIDEVALQDTKETLDTDIVPTVPPSRPVAGDSIASWPVTSSQSWPESLAMHQPGNECPYQRRVLTGIVTSDFNILPLMEMFVKSREGQRWATAH